MRQRLTLATTLLGDPGVLILDEPLNGLDPDGIRWMRDLLGQLAGEGRTVLVSSHLLAEAAQTVEDVVVIHRGRLAAEGPVAELAAATSTTRIRTPDTELLMSVLARQEITTHLVTADTVEVRGADPDRVARIAAAASVIVLELTRHTENLEELFFDLTSDHANDRALEVRACLKLTCTSSDVGMMLLVWPLSWRSMSRCWRRSLTRSCLIWMSGSGGC